MVTYFWKVGEMCKLVTNAAAAVKGLRAPGAGTVANGQHAGPGMPGMPGPRASPRLPGAPHDQARTHCRYHRE
jgi:hypothetical protein